MAAELSSQASGATPLSQSVAAELVDALQKLKAKRPNSKWESFRVALAEVWTRSQIEDFTGRIQLLQGHAMAHMQFLIM
jgi:hypothetical protein